MTISAAYGSFAKRQHQVRPIYTSHVMKAFKSAQPDQWHTVRNNKPGGVMDVSHSFFAIGFHNAVHSGNAHVVRFAARNPFVDGVQRHRGVYGTHSNSKNI